MDILESSRTVADGAEADGRASTENDAPRDAPHRRRLPKSYAGAGEAAGTPEDAGDERGATTPVAPPAVELEEAGRAAEESADAHGQAALAGALTALGVAQARRGLHEEARQNLLRAAQTAEAAGEREAAGAAALALAEELAEHMTRAELCEALARAQDLLAGSHDHETLSRLSACALRALSSLSPPGPHAVEPEERRGTAEERWKGFSLKAEVLRHESELISRALHDADGVVSRAAKLLGFRHHQTFVALLNNRHKGLLHARSPIVPRRRSLIRPRRTHDRPGD